ncbi:DUF6950 family protein [Salipiger marinus]|uniref:DUF6950 family protein n=1 Tax=Salipiger marinus TaxID=555512 RepID=UPI002B94E8D3|nr:hypothetical protein [Salipiger manganoxidans]MEB3421724.1 hypothetical protein [Salipiger manganoxidans]
MTPAEVMRVADPILSAPPPRGWLDCALAVDLVLRALTGRSGLGDLAGAYATPGQARRLIRRGGGAAALFRAGVIRAGMVPCGDVPGAVGFSAAGRWGFAVAICAGPGLWLVPVHRGFAVRASMDSCWRIE